MSEEKELSEFLNEVHKTDGHYMGSKINLIELQNKIHAQNKSAGWWDEPRPFSTFVCLFHSELSEAMEGDRKCLMDDHLPQYPMFQVELADFVIRCMDWLGSVGNESVDTTPYRARRDVHDFLCVIHWYISQTWQDSQFRSVNPKNLTRVVAMCFEFSKAEGFDLHQIILEKVEYNKHRADHKRENREKEGGKKY